MDKGLLVFIVVLIVFAAVFLVSLAYANSGGASTVSRNFSFAKPVVAYRLTVNRKHYVVYRIPGVELDVKPGQPILPVKTYVFKLPYLCRVLRLDFTAKHTVLASGVRILPGPTPMKLGERANASMYREDPSIYESSKPYPPSPVEWEVKRGIDPYTLERHTFVVVRIYPVQYIPRSGQLLFYSSVNVRVEYEAGPMKQSLQGVDLVVITSQALEPAALELAQWKNSTGHVAKVYTVEWIDANFPGQDLPAKIRNFINYTVNTLNTKWVILLGDSDVVPARYAYIPDLSYQGGYVETDLYYADLQGTWDTNGDGKYGEVNDSIDGYPDVIVGRLPASSLTEAYNIVHKLEGYSPVNSWFRRILLLGTVTFGDELRPEGEILKDYIEENFLAANFSWLKLYEGIGNLTVSSATAAMNSGYGIVDFAGHGNVDLWYFGSGGTFTNATALSLSNGYNCSVVVAMSCLTASFADTNVCIGEAFLLNPSGGAIAYLGASDVAYGYVGYYITEGLAGEIDWRFVKAFKDLEDSGVTPTPGLMHVITIEAYLNKHGRSDEYDWYTVVEYGSLLGDPTLSLAGTGAPPPPPPQPVLYGYVVNQSGRPVANALVKLYNYTTGQLLAEYNATNGYYEFTGLPHGTYRLVITAPGYTERTADFYYPHARYEYNVTLYPPPSFKPNTVLVVVDDDGQDAGTGPHPEDFTSVLEALGFNVYVWNESTMGNPSLDVLENENVTAVIWHAGTYYGKAVDDSDAQNLLQFVSDGGRLLLEGEDIGYDHDSDQFMENVAHANYLVDNTGSSAVVATALHPVVYNITVADFSTQPPYPDGVQPVNGGVEVAAYQGTSYSAVVVYDGVGGQGCRVVYIAFPLHYLDAQARAQLIKNAVLWITHSYRGEARANSSVYEYNSTALIVASLYNGTRPLPGALVRAYLYYPNGSLAGIYTMVDDGTRGDAKPGDGNYTLLLNLTSLMPSGQYRVVVNATVPGYQLPTYADLTFRLVPSLSASFNITVEDVDVVSGVIRMNLTVSDNASLVITMVQYRVDGGQPVNITSPIDGSYDSSCETVHLEVDTSSYALGYHTIEVKVYAEGGQESGWVAYHFRVRELKAKYNLIALSLQPLKTVMASDLAKSVGPSLLGIWRWDPDKQEFVSYIPGVSSPSEDFPIEPGYGYFVYLSCPARLVEVGV